MKQEYKLIFYWILMKMTRCTIKLDDLHTSICRVTALVPMQMSFSGKCVRTMLGDCSMVMRDLAWMSWKERAFVILSVKSIRKYCIQRKQKYPVQIQLIAPWDKYQIEKQFKLLKLEMFFFNSGKACRVLKRVSEDAWTSYTSY